MYTDLLWVNWGYEIHKYRKNLRVLVVAYWTSMWSPLVTHKNGSHSHANIRQRVCFFWFTATWNASFGYIKILRHFVHGLSLMYRHKKSDTVVFSKVWHHPHFHHITMWVPVIACTVIWKDFVTRYGSEHIYISAVSGMLCCCMRSFQFSSLNATWDK
jgi:hypothetical protein